MDTNRHEREKLKSAVGKAMNMDGQDIQDEEQGAAARHLSCTSCSSMLEFPGFIRVHSCPFVDGRELPVRIFAKDTNGHESARKGKIEECSRQRNEHGWTGYTG